jgi:hypothetical protein
MISGERLYEGIVSLPCGTTSYELEEFQSTNSKCPVISYQMTTSPGFSQTGCENAALTTDCRTVTILNSDSIGTQSV